MILTDRMIAERIANDELIEKDSNYDPDRISSISYDINIGKIVTDEKQEGSEKYKDVNKYYLQPNETIFIRSDVKLKIPNDCVGFVYERNSVMRQGLVVDAPVYQPGHTTYAFLRVQNIFAQEKELCTGDPIAQIRFERLEEEPSKPYNRDDDSYQNEESYRGVQGDLKHSWESETFRYKKKVDELNEKENRIYANVLTFMGIFISIFSLLTFSFSAVAQQINIKSIILLDMSIFMIMYLLVGTIFIVTNRIKRNRLLCSYIVFGIILFLTNIGLWIYWLH